MGIESGKAFQASNVLLLSLPRPVTARLASGQGHDGAQAVEYGYTSLIRGFNGAGHVDGTGQGRLAAANGIGVQQGVATGGEMGRFPSVEGLKEQSVHVAKKDDRYGPEQIGGNSESGQGPWQPPQHHCSKLAKGFLQGQGLPDGRGAVYDGAVEGNGMNIGVYQNHSNNSAVRNAFGDGASGQYVGAQSGSRQPEPSRLAAPQQQMQVPLQPESSIPQHRCCHQVPYDVCTHKKAHLSGISAELDAVCEQLAEADAYGEHVKELQRECKRLLEIKNALKRVCLQPSATMQMDTMEKKVAPSACVQVQSAGATTNMHQAMGTGCVAMSGPGQSEYAGYHQQAGPGHSNATYRMPYDSSRHEKMMDANPEWNEDLPAQQQILEVDTHILQRVHADRVDASDDPAWKMTDFPWSDAMNHQNIELFGNSSFRLHQLAVINATLAGRDVFVLMPTGGGKSLCYQLPAVLSSGVTVVVTPLVSLIQDQVFHLTNLGISARLLASYEKNQDGGETMREVMRGNVKVLFLTPEKLEQSAGTRSMLEKLHAEKRLSRVVIDEAHCVSQWGHGRCFAFC